MSSRNGVKTPSAGYGRPVLMRQARKAIQMMKKEIAKKKTYTKLKEAMGGSAYIEEGGAWLKSGKYPSPSVSIDMDENETLSDFMRHITLKDVTLVVGKNPKGYPELTIMGGKVEDIPF